MTRPTDSDYPGGNDWLVRTIAAAFPELDERLKEHTRQNDGDVIPYVFFGVDIWPWFEAQFNSGTAEGMRVSLQLVQMLETEQARRDDETSNLIGVEFLECLIGDPSREAMRAILPPALREELARMESSSG